MDMYFFEEVVGEVAKEVVVRVGLGFGILGFPTKVAKTPEEYIKRAKEFVKAFKGEKLVFPVLCPHGDSRGGREDKRNLRKYTRYALGKVGYFGPKMALCPRGMDHRRGEGNTQRKGS
jgi:cytosine/adenosine deaminase-related metal-dependent hydrolase